MKTDEVKFPLIFRFDDVSGNTDYTLLYDIIDFLRSKLKCMIWLCVSPLYSTTAKDGRVFPELYNAYSDYRIHFNVDMCKLHKVKREGVQIASHGLVHVDHRLLSYEGQEMSIVTSRFLLDSKIFVPPFNKWNKDTEKICNDHLISLVKFEDGWHSAEYNNFTLEKRQWYLHSWKWSLLNFKEWIEYGLCNTSA